MVQIWTEGPLVFPLPVRRKTALKVVVLTAEEDLVEVDLTEVEEIQEVEEEAEEGNFTKNYLNRRRRQGESPLRFLYFVHEKPPAGWQGVFFYQYLVADF